MTNNTWRVIKTVLVAAIAAAVHSLIENAPQILPLIPAKYSTTATVLIGAAALYLKKPPSGGSPNSPTDSGVSLRGPSTPSTGAVVGMTVLGVFAGALALRWWCA